MPERTGEQHAVGVMQSRHRLMLFHVLFQPLDYLSARSEETGLTPGWGNICPGQALS